MVFRVSAAVRCLVGGAAILRALPLNPSLQPSCASWLARWACCATWRPNGLCGAGGAGARRTITWCTASEAVHPLYCPFLMATASSEAGGLPRWHPQSPLPILPPLCDTDLTPCCSHLETRLIATTHTVDRGIPEPLFHLIAVRSAPFHLFKLLPFTKL